jgi:integrase
MNLEDLQIRTHKGAPHFRWYARAGHGRLVPRFRKIKSPDDQAAVERERGDLLVELRTDKPAKIAKQQSLPLVGDDSHLSAYLRYLSAIGAKPFHVDQTKMRIERVFTIAKIKRYSDITLSKIVTVVGELRCMPKNEHQKPENMRLLAGSSRNHYYQSLKQFCKWLSKEQKLGPSPLVELQAKRKVKVKPNKRDRVQPDELVKLIDTAEKSTVEIEGVDGPTRAMLYRLAVFTGFRRGELASLRPSSFKLTEQPFVTVAAAYTKNGDPASQHLNPTLVPLLKTWLAKAEGDELLFPGLRGKKTWKLVQFDLKTAKLPIRTPDGIRNFHALRNTFISMVLDSGVDPKTAQELARHSDINLTLAYARPVKGAAIAAINMLRLPEAG